MNGLLQAEITYDHLALSFHFIRELKFTFQGNWREPLLIIGAKRIGNLFSLPLPPTRIRFQAAHPSADCRCHAISFGLTFRFSPSHLEAGKFGGTVAVETCYK